LTKRNKNESLFLQTRTNCNESFELMEADANKESQ